MNKLKDKIEARLESASFEVTYKPNYKPKYSFKPVTKIVYDYEIEKGVSLRLNIKTHEIYLNLGKQTAKVSDMITKVAGPYYIENRHVVETIKRCLSGLKFKASKNKSDEELIDFIEKKVLANKSLQEKIQDVVNEKIYMRVYY